MQPIRVVLADDHVVLRTTLRSWLQVAGGIEVVGVASSGDEAAELIVDKKPDIALLDIDMPGRTCFDLCDAMKGLSPGTKIILLSGYANDRYIKMALDAAVAGYVTKDEHPDTVVEAIRRVSGGERFFSPAVAGRLRGDGAPDRAAEAPTRLDRLSAREKEVLVQLARGRSLKEVASSLKLSPKTVDNHTQRLMAKLDIHSRAELVRFAIREQLVEP